MTAKADNRTTRESNRALLLELLRESGTITRSDLARHSALAKPTVSVIVDGLIEEGVVCEVGPGARRSRGGPRGRLLSLNADAAAFVGIHFGVQRTSVAIADAMGKIRVAKSVASFREDATRAMRETPEMVLSMLHEAGMPPGRLHGVGVAVPGLVHHETGTCVLAPNLGWNDVPVRESLSRALNAPATVRNSMQAGAIAEARLGVGRDARSFAWVYVGTGVGAAIVVDGRVLYGKRGYTGEIGHWKVADDGVPCACGRRGCLETVASNFAIEAAARASSVQAPGSESLDAHAVAVAASRGDPRARRTLEGVGEYLGIAVSSLLNLLDLEMVVLDGVAIRAGDCLIDRIRSSVAKHTIGGQGIPIVKSSVEHDVMLRGAVLLAMEGEFVDRVMQGDDWGRCVSRGASRVDEAPFARPFALGEDGIARASTTRATILAKTGTAAAPPVAAPTGTSSPTSAGARSNTVPTKLA